MSVFGNYAKYYDLLYQDKDYQQESDFIITLLKEYSPHAKHLLELGCGTGRHAEYLLKAGYHVTGVERSPEMLEVCRQRQQQLSPDLQPFLRVMEGDLRTLRLGQKFDAVLALFHVISYQVTNDDLLAAFSTVREHLRPGGIFFFDVWYGPAVLSDRPVPRLKRIETSDYIITRFAQPILYPNENCVDVHYQIYLQESYTKQSNFFEETHQMRYLFKPELEFFLRQVNLKIINSGQWLTQQTIDQDTWNVYFIVNNR
ncbi:class I SAM-dependent DNA methyltransferase [Trichothermofontia sp.]